MRSSPRKQTHCGRTMFVRRTVQSTYAPVDISRNRGTAAPEALRCEILSEPQLPVTRRPTIPTVSQPNQPAEIPVADFPAVPSEVNDHRCGRYMDGYINRLSDTKLELCYICETL